MPEIDCAWGIFGARADTRGLAVQTMELARHLEPDRVFGIDMKELSPYPNDWGDFNAETLTVRSHDEVDFDEVKKWLSGLDVVLGCETFYYPWFTRLAEVCGVKTILVANYEFTSHVTSPEWYPLPTVLAVPTRWHIDDLPNAVHLPHGIDRERLPFRLRSSARTFLHIIGHSAAHDRQGTKIVLEAMRFVESDIRLIIRSQRGTTVPRGYRPNVEFEVQAFNLPNYWDLFNEGDVLLHPRRYGGQSLVMNEALSTGMPVIMPNTSPQNEFLPPEMMLPCNSFRRFRSLVGDIPLHDIAPRDLAIRIDELANDPQQVQGMSQLANQLADRQSWPNVFPLYKDLFESLCR